MNDIHFISVQNLLFLEDTVQIKTNILTKYKKVILLDNNLLSDVPPLIQTLPNLHTLTLRGNNFNSPPSPVIDEGTNHILL